MPNYLHSLAMMVTFCTPTPFLNCNRTYNHVNVTYVQPQSTCTVVLLGCSCICVRTTRIPRLVRQNCANSILGASILERLWKCFHRSYTRRGHGGLFFGGAIAFRAHSLTHSLTTLFALCGFSHSPSLWKSSLRFCVGCNVRITSLVDGSLHRNR